MAAKWNHTSTSGSLLLLIFSPDIGRQTFLLIGTSPVVMRSPYSLSTGSSRLAFKSSGPPLLLMAPSTPPPPKPPRLAALTIASLVSGQATVGCFLDGRMVLLLYRDLSLLTIIIASSSSSSSSCFFLFPLLVSSSFFFFLFLLCSSSCFFFVFLFLLLFSSFSFLFSFFFFFVFLLFSSSCFFCFFLLLFSSFLFFFLFLRLLILLILLNYSFYWSYSCSYHYSCVLLISSVLSTSPRCATSVLFTKSTNVSRPFPTSGGPECSSISFIQDTPVKSTTLPLDIQTRVDFTLKLSWTVTSAKQIQIFWDNFGCFRMKINKQIWTSSKGANVSFMQTWSSLH